MAKSKKSKQEQKPKEENSEEIKRLYRSNKDKVIAGVCGGIAEYLNIDPVWVRLAAVLSIFADGIGILMYIIAWILIPKNPVQKDGKMTFAENTVEKAGERGGKSYVIGIFLIILGAIFLMKNLFSWFSYNYVWPIAIVCVGAYLIIKR